MHLSVAALVLAFACTAAVANESAVTSELSIHAIGFKHTHGHAVAKLFSPGDSVLGRGRWEAKAVIADGMALFRFTDLPAGRYAAVVFHDDNDNGVIDHGLLGPSEPIGFSERFVLSVFSGRPTFQDLSFTFTPPSQTLDVRVR